jgi:hypothetical protein
LEGGTDVSRRASLFLVVVAAVVVSGCALRSPSIADLQHRPGRYVDRTVEVRGEVTSSWGIPFVPFKFYKVTDGTGELTVVGHGSAVPVRGAHVRVRGRLNEFAVFGGRSVGMHLEERSLHVYRW